jgi:hypothetical protein
MFTLPAEGQAGLSAEASKVTQNTICIVVKKGRFGVRRKVNTSQISVQADKSLLALSKCILESPELKKVQQADSAISTYLKSVCLKSMFRGGIYLLPIGLVEEVNDALQTFVGEREALVDTATQTYDQRCTETSTRLNVLHTATDYPSPERFRQKFYFEWQFVTWETPTQLRRIRPALFEAEREKAAAKLSAVADECRIAMRAGMKSLVDHLADRLTPGADGKPKRFSKRTVENFNDFFRTFELKNVTDDEELAAVVTKAKSVLAGVNVDTLRKDEAIRAALQQQFEQLQTQMVPMTVEPGTREIDLDDDDDDDDA